MRSVHLLPALVTASWIFAALPAGAQGTSAAEKPVGEQLYDVVAAGLPHPFPGHRINHAKGGLFEGTFTASPEAAKLTMAAHMQGQPVPMLIRFSNAGGIPDAPDNAPSAGVRAMAMTFTLPDGSATDLMAISPDFFPVATPEDFIALNQAAQASKPGTPSPTPIQAFLAGHPAAAKFVAAPKPMPESYATEAYHAIHAYKLINAAGEATYVRYTIVPEAGLHFLSADDAAKTAPNVLLDEIRARLTTAPVKFRLTVELAGAGDPVNDPTIKWPSIRPTVDLGEIVVTKAVPNSEQAERKVGFLPTKVTKGIEISDDPILKARSETYAVAYPRRQ